MTKNASEDKPVCGLPRSDEELKSVLTPEQYRIMRQSGTERPFDNEYWNNHRTGIYVDRISGKPLFSSKDKFDSGTGWPSFSAPIDPAAVAPKKDLSHSMLRTEVRSSSSDSHLGHVFDDGPGPRGQRYCINSAALKFIPAERLEAEGYGAYLPQFSLEPQGGKTGARQYATFAAGCFWGVEAAFRKVPGVLDAAAGYTGGNLANPTYEQVCSDQTGHAEAVRVAYDPAQVSYEKLLETFWGMHDPTTLNRQGPDIGSQYRSAVFFHSPEQAEAARAFKDKLEGSGRFKRPIKTQIVPAGEFYQAEEYHQRYLEKQGRTACHF